MKTQIKIKHLTLHLMMMLVFLLTGIHLMANQETGIKTPATSNTLETNDTQAQAAHIKTAAAALAEYNNVQTVEEEIVIEDWMLSAKEPYWKQDNEVQAMDEEIKIESWMTDLSQW